MADPILDAPFYEGKKGLSIPPSYFVLKVCVRFTSTVKAFDKSKVVSASKFEKSIKKITHTILVSDLCDINGCNYFLSYRRV